MSKQRENSTTTVKRDGKLASSPTSFHQTSTPHPITDDRDAWSTYWIAQGQPWRTEPEIDPKRQTELAQRRTVAPDLERGVYPFKGMKLSRADIEWLLATHENGRGPVDWGDESQREREGLDMRGADLRQVDLQYLPLARMQGGLYRDARALATAEQYEMATVHLEGADLSKAHLEGASLFRAHLEEARLYLAFLKEAYLREAHLERTDLFRAHLQEAILRGAYLGGANLRRAYVEGAELERVVLTDEHRTSPRLADVHWGDNNLTGVKWSQIEILGDEHKARLRKAADGSVKKKAKQFEEYEVAVRAYHQLTNILQEQGLNEEAARFAYRAQVLRKRVLWYQLLQSGVTLRSRFQTLGAWLFSWFIFLLAGYGYRPSRSFLAYFLVIAGFATAYYVIGHTVGPTLSPLGAFVFSMTSFHGRGFFPGNNISLDDPLTVLAALEALVGLIIEVTFIATLTQRLFSR